MRTVLSDDISIISSVKHIDKPDNIDMVERFDDLNFLLKQMSGVVSRNVFFIYNFECNYLVCLCMCSNIDNSVGSFSNDSLKTE